MHILVLTTSFPSSTNPGSGIFIRSMLTRLPEEVLITVLTPSALKSCGFSSKEKRISVRTFRYAPRAWQLLAHQPGGLPGMISHKPWRFVLAPAFCAAMVVAAWRHCRYTDLIHAQWALSGLIGGIVGRLKGKPVVTTLRGTDVNWAQESIAFRLILRCCVALSSKLITVNHDLAAQLACWFPCQKDRVRVIANGVGERFWDIRHQPAAYFNISAIGNLIKLKQMDLVLNVFAKLTERYHNTRLFIIGEGPEKPFLQKLACRLRINNRIEFAGQCHPDQMPGLLANSDVLVLASRSEGRPNVILEAMAAGVPVVASDIPGIRELIEHKDRGLLFKVGNAAQLEHCLKSLIADPAFARKLAQSARQWLQAQNMTWADAAANYMQTYHRLLKQHTKVD